MSNASEPAVLDRDRMRQITRGNDALAADFLRSLIEEADDLLARLELAIALYDGDAVRDLAHSLKGMATELGAHRLRAVAILLEAEREPARWPECSAGARTAVAELRAL